MSVHCAACGTDNPPGFKFCGGCGGRLDAEKVAPSPPAPRTPEMPVRESEERKIVTVLFADIQGFTALSELLDPEEVRDMIQGLFLRLTGLINRYGGTVDKYIGDCIMALFGAPVAHENDPERAIRAAIEMQRDIAQFCVEHHVDIHMRIGINTGTVLAGYIGDRSGDYTVMGDEVNLASRLEKAAPTDGILISQKTHDPVEELFECESLEPILVKGKREPVKIYRVLRERIATQRHYITARKIESRMVGRDEQLERMLELVRESTELGERRFLLITSPAGGGKSRLLYEFHHALAAMYEKRGNDEGGSSAPRTFKARSLPYATNIPYYLFGSLLKNLCGIVDEDSVADVRLKLLDGVRAVMATATPDQDDPARANDPAHAAEEITHLMASLINIDFPESPYVAPLKHDPIQLSQQARAAFVEFFRHAAAEPLIVYLEDFHWVEQSSIDLLVDIFQDNRSRPLLIIAGARPEFFDRFPEAPLIFPSLETMALSSLSPEAVRALVRDLLKEASSIPKSLEKLVIEKTDGNPYYVEEMIKMFRDNGVVEKSSSGERIVEEKLGEIDIPDTIQGLLQSRLDHLTANEKGVLQRASVVGRTFWAGALPVLMEGLTVDSAEPILSDLTEKAFVFDTRQSFSQSRNFMGTEYIFKHALLRDVTYQTILRKTRARYHALLAEWIESNGGDRKEEFLSLIAMHHELGGNRERAREYYYLAGEQARLTFANVEALSYFEKTITLAEREAGGARPLGPAPCAPTFSHYRRRGGVREILGIYEGALEDYRVLLRMARHPTEEGIARKHLAEIHTRLGNYAEARDHAEAAARIAEELGDPRMSAETSNIMGRIHDYAGRTDLALEYYTRSMEAHRAQGNALGEATGLGNIGIIHMYRAEYSEAIEAYKAALDLDRAAGNKRRMTIMMSNLGEVYQFLGAFEQAQAYHREALTLARTIGFKMMQVEALRNLGMDTVFQGRHDEGIAMMRDALSMVEDFKDMELLPQVLHSLGEGLALAGHDDPAHADERLLEALDLVRRLLDIVEAREVKDYIAKGILLKNVCLSDQARASSAHRDELERGLRIAEELQSRSLIWEFHGALAQVASDAEDARRHLEIAVAEIEAVGERIKDDSLRAVFFRSRGVAAIFARASRFETEREKVS